MNSTKQLHLKIKRHTRIWRLALFADVLLRTFALGILLILLFAVLDRWLSLSETFIQIYRGILSAFLFVLLLIAAVRIMRIRRIDTAIRMDRKRRSGRAYCRTALELEAIEPNSDFQQYLIEQQHKKALQQIHELSIMHYLPMDALKKALLIAGIALMIPVLLTFYWHAPLITALQRFTHPEYDIPPYSPFTFEITPAAPRALYGGDIELAVSISGAPVTRQVHLVSKNDRTSNHIPCFQDGTNRYIQRLNRLTQPVSFCFKTGRARSKWVPVELLLQPRIESSLVTLSPPAYSRKPQRIFDSGSEPIEDLFNTTVQLDVRSNRPVLDGTLTITDTRDQITTIEGASIDLHTIRFTWKLKSRALIKAVIRDVRGTACNTPLQLSQSVLPDQPPEVTLLSPGTRVLATPDSSVPLAANAHDDIGLSDLYLVRTVDQFRDRETPIAREINNTDFSWESQLDLAPLGVHAGQVIECYLEARDNNPLLSGISASGIGRIEIISIEDFTELVRVNTSIEEFVARFNATQNAMREVLNKLKALQQAAEQNDKAAMAAARQEALESIEQAERLFKQLEQDYAVYDEEKALAQTLGESLKKLGDVKEMIQLTPTPLDANSIQLAAALAMDELQPPMKKLEQQNEDAGEVAAVAKVMECAARMRRLIGTQETITRYLKRFEAGTPQQSVGMLAQLSSLQEQVKQEYLSILSDITTRAAVLSPGYKTLRDTALSFEAKARELDIDSPMQQSATQAATGKGKAAFRYATIALERLQRLLSGQCDNCFGGMCQPKFHVPDYRQTLKDMLKSLCKRYGDGTGQGQGNGGGIGGGANGFWMQGYSMQVPVIGPQRSSFRQQSFGSVQGFNGSPGVTEGNRSSTVSETVPSQAGGQPDGKAQSTTETPPQYRSLIRRYFSNE